MFRDEGSDGANQFGAEAVAMTIQRGFEIGGRNADDDGQPRIGMNLRHEIGGGLGTFDEDPANILRQNLRKPLCVVSWHLVGCPSVLILCHGDLSQLEERNRRSGEAAPGCVLLFRQQIWPSRVGNLFAVFRRTSGYWERIFLMRLKLRLLIALAIYITREVDRFSGNRAVRMIEVHAVTFVDTLNARDWISAFKAPDRDKLCFHNQHDFTYLVGRCSHPEGAGFDDGLFTRVWLRSRHAVFGTQLLGVVKNAIH